MRTRLIAAHLELPCACIQMGYAEHAIQQWGRRWGSDRVIVPSLKTRVNVKKGNFQVCRPRSPQSHPPRPRGRQRLPSSASLALAHVNCAFSFTASHLGLPQVHDRLAVAHEVHIDIQMLARCNYLLHGASATAEAAIYTNPSLHWNSTDLEYQHACDVAAACHDAPWRWSYPLPSTGGSVVRPVVGR